MLREAHKRQIESIVRLDKKNADDYGLRDSTVYDDQVVERYPTTFYGVDPTDAAEYYDFVWTDG